MPEFTPTLADALAEAAGGIARLDEALTSHPLREAFLYRIRLEAIRRQAAVDGRSIDPWHLAAVLEGLRLRMDGALGIIDRGEVLAAAQHAFALHQWLTAPADDQETMVRRAEAHLASFDYRESTPLLAAAHGFHAWLDTGGARAAIRAALIRYWTRRGIVQTPLPLTGAAALHADTPWTLDVWLVVFLRALAAEAVYGRNLLIELERRWFSARAAVVNHRRDSHIAACVDILAATPLVSSTSLAGFLGIAVNNAIRLLERLLAAGIVIEVSHRSKRRLYGLAGLAPLRESVAAPRRPEPGRGRGQPRRGDLSEDVNGTTPPLLPPLTPVERHRFDYTDVEQAIARLDQAIGQTARSLDVLAGRRAMVDARLGGPGTDMTDTMSRSGGDPSAPSALG